MSIHVATHCVSQYMHMRKNIILATFMYVTTGSYVASYMSFLLCSYVYCVKTNRDHTSTIKEVRRYTYTPTYVATCVQPLAIY